LLKFLVLRPWSSLALAGLLVMMGVALATSDVRASARSMYLIDGLARAARGPGLLQAMAQPVEKVRQQALASDGNRVAVDVYQPLAVTGRLPAILLIPGFNSLGLDDPHVARIAQLLSGLGMVVAVPDLRALFEYRWSPTVGDQIEAAFEHLITLPHVQADRVGLFGWSISGGLGLAAATRPSIAGRLSYAIAFAPYQDFSRLLNYVATGCRDAHDTRCVTEVSSFSRLILLYNYLHAAVPESSKDYSVMREILRLKLYGQGDGNAALIDELSVDSRDLLRQLEAGNREALQPIAARAIADVEPSYSPGSNLCNLRGSLYLIHGRQDTVIPSTESERLYEQCTRCGGGLSCKLLMTNVYTHADMTASVVRELPEYWRLLVFVHGMAATMLDGGHN
jgi:acetyl esterase/lipase